MNLVFKDGAYLPHQLQIGSATITFYGVCIVLGMLLAVYLGVKEAKRLGIGENIIYDGALIILPLSVLGARLYYVLVDNFSHPTRYNWNFGKIFDFSTGGLAIHGGIIVAFVGVFIYTKIRHVSLWKILDLVAPGFLIAQALGRWGNFFNQEVYGGIVTGDNPLGWLPEFIRQQMFIDGAYRVPLFLYESILNLFLFVVFMIIRRKKLLRIGDLACIYFIWYGVIRAILEPLRDSTFILTSASNNMQSVITSVLLIVVGIIVMVVKYIFFKLPYYKDCLDVIKDNNEQEIVKE